MPARTSLIGIGVAGALVVGLVTGLAQAHETSPPSLGDTIEVTPSPTSGRGKPHHASDEPGATPASPGAAAPTAPSGGHAVAPPPAPPDDGDEGPSGDDGPDDGADDGADGGANGGTNGGADGDDDDDG